MFENQRVRSADVRAWVSQLARYVLVLCRSCICSPTTQYKRLLIMNILITTFQVQTDIK